MDPSGRCLGRAIVCGRVSVRRAGMEVSTAPQAASQQYREPADALVIFGISGDLARKMTFRALYRLERRGRLDCPIIGVAPIFAHTVRSSSTTPARWYALFPCR